ncbi:hypothetical protein [Eggerthella guodeyinii]|uniref:Uncharacterized protein n=1 Tax=Eggerthella guodeyinii TaxID=2690837 RepID=A0A6N7RLU5_9ACTN|nr:hypothetical protein [Eggerthella guodeyinii]MRX82239.1 hypothetical protein [Eggerthella guodeyinii]
MIETVELTDAQWDAITRQVAQRSADAFKGFEAPVKITHKTANGEEYIVYEKGGEDDSRED